MKTFKSLFLVVLSLGSLKSFASLSCPVIGVGTRIIPTETTGCVTVDSSVMDKINSGAIKAGSDFLTLSMKRSIVLIQDRGNIVLMDVKEIEKIIGENKTFAWDSPAQLLAFYKWLDGDAPNSAIHILITEDKKAVLKGGPIQGVTEILARALPAAESFGAYAGTSESTTQAKPASSGPGKPKTHPTYASPY